MNVSYKGEDYIVTEEVPKEGELKVGEIVWCELSGLGMVDSFDIENKDLCIKYFKQTYIVEEDYENVKKAYKKEVKAKHMNNVPKVVRKIKEPKAKKVKVWVPPVLDLTLTLESIGAKIGDKVMLGSGPHEIVSFDVTKPDQVGMKPLDGRVGIVRRDIHTVKLNLIK